MAKKKNGKSNGHSNGNGGSEFSKRNKSLLGYNAIFTPEVIDDIHIKAQLGRYRMRGMALMKKIPTFDDLVFLPGTLTRFVIEGYREKCETKTIIGPRCENPVELDIPVYITGMSKELYRMKPKQRLQERQLWRVAQQFGEGEYT
jgi:hypothetical protein